MSDPTYSGYLKWITITSVLLAVVGWIISVFIYIGISKIFPSLPETISGDMAIILYVVIFLILWIVIYRKSTYKGYVERE